MVTFVSRFFIALGVVFFILLLGIGYIVVTDSWKVRTLLVTGYKLINGTPGSQSIIETTTPPVSEEISSEEGQMQESAAATETKSVLTPAQEDALQLVGIDAGVLPESLTPEQEACFVEKFGQERVSEIKGGAVPSVTEILAGSSCVGENGN